MLRLQTHAQAQLMQRYRLYSFVCYAGLFWGKRSSFSVFHISVVLVLGLGLV